MELLLKLADKRRDQKITRKLKATCETIDVQLHDHLIIAGNDFTSMVDEGMVYLIMNDQLLIVNLLLPPPT